MLSGITKANLAWRRVPRREGRKVKGNLLKLERRSPGGLWRCYYAKKLKVQKWQENSLSWTFQKAPRLTENPLYSPGWPLNHGNPPAVAYWVLRLQIAATIFISRGTALSHRYFSEVTPISDIRTLRLQGGASAQLKGTTFMVICNSNSRDQEKRPLFLEFMVN